MPRGQIPPSVMSVLKRKAFVRAYLGEANGNATKAATLAGYSEHTAKQQGSRLLSKVDVQQDLQRHANKLDTSTERTLQRVAVIACTEPTKITAKDVLNANELILKANGALLGKDASSRITINLGFLSTPEPTVTLTLNETTTTTTLDAQVVGRDQRVPALRDPVTD